MSGSSATPLEFHVFTGGPFQENGYLVRCPAAGKVVVVDPGFAAPEMVRAIRQWGIEVEAIYLTHAHLDHVEGLPVIREFTDAPIHLHPADLPLYERAADQAAAFGMRLPAPLPAIDVSLEGVTSLPVGDGKLAVHRAPGHAPGHVIFHSPEAGVALVGDVIFFSSIGRTDLPGGDFQELMDSIRTVVLTLPDETRLLSGHGPETTVAQERIGNPFLRPHMLGEFA